MKADSGEKSSSYRETFDVVYERAFPRLRGIAEKLLSRERVGHTLQPTALVHESYLKLRAYWSRVENEQHFYSLSARTMRQVLVDSFRSRGKARRVSMEDVAGQLSVVGSERHDMEHDLALRLTWERLQTVDARAGKVVWLRYVEGLSLEEIAERLQLTVPRVRVDCAFGVQWMAGRLRRTSL